MFNLLKEIEKRWRRCKKKKHKTFNIPISRYFAIFSRSFGKEVQDYNESF